MIREMDYTGRPIDQKSIKPGDVFRTASGRTTTPYPKQKSLRYGSKWLIDNAIDEADARGDTFNGPIFRAIKLKKDGTLIPADGDSLTEYLFGEIHQ